ncbi:hypothetical protein NE237_025509 [Protea cynaroides]|uniref:Uncharacterized protein n=1 Tax=Protea cynaroides TaxID=273540 RepID=A0A9Q0K1T8_9MAGN|nr:hypothetical protein NE237_025509 [Protea cynaroides]
MAVGGGLPSAPGSLANGGFGRGYGWGASRGPGLPFLVVQHGATVTDQRALQVSIPKDNTFADLAFHERFSYEDDSILLGIPRMESVAVDNREDDRFIDAVSVFEGAVLETVSSSPGMADLDMDQGPRRCFDPMLAEVMIQVSKTTMANSSISTGTALNLPIVQATITSDHGAHVTREQIRRDAVQPIRPEGHRVRVKHCRCSVRDKGQTSVSVPMAMDVQPATMASGVIQLAEKENLMHIG